MKSRLDLILFIIYPVTTIINIFFVKCKKLTIHRNFNKLIKVYAIWYVRIYNCNDNNMIILDILQALKLYIRR